MKQILLLLLIIFTLSIPCLAQEKDLPKGKLIVDSAQGILIGKAVNLATPAFPSGCKCKFTKDKKVSVQFTVTKEGYVESAKGIAGHPLLRAACEGAIRNSKFTISRENGLPVKSTGIIIYDFVLSKNKWKTRVLNYELKIEKDN